MADTLMKKHQKQVNINQAERIASLIGGGSLVAFGLKRGGWDGYLMATLGGVLAYRGATGHCDVYQAFGIQTDRRTGKNVSVPYELGVRVDKVITVNKPAEQIYKFWRNLENLPKFMHHLESVKEIDNKQSHWVAKAIGGTAVQWDAEVIHEEENRLIGWRTLPGADVPNAGSVHFTPAPDNRGTVVKIELQYDPPGGAVAAALAKLFGSDPEKQIDEDLRRFKQLMETGEVPTTKGQPAGPRSSLAKAVQNKPSTKGWNRDVVGESSQESFPASDPPSWTPAALSK